MPIRLQQGIISAFGLVAAIWAGFALAHESYAAPIGLTAIVFAATASWLRIRYEAVLVAIALCGYVVGNRGFAQLMLLPQFPLLVAELVLGLSLTALLVSSAVTKISPIRRDALNAIILLWLLVGGIRIAVDFRDHGFVALRDSAMCYYGLFFFLGQSIGGDPAGRRWLHGALLAGLGLLPFLFAFWSAAPELFLNRLTFGGVPLIHYKADIVATLLAAAVFYFFHWTRRGYRPAWLLVAACFFGAVMPNTRAAVLGFAVGLGFWMLARRWRLPLALALLSVLAATVDIGVVMFRQRPVTESRTVQIAQYAATILPFTDAGIIDLKSDDVKGNPVDNNFFRLVWWRTILDETWRDHPLIGMGFGYDLASQFLIEYGLMGDADFTARSPHSILMSTFGRLGLIGLAILIALFAAILRRTLQAVQDTRRDPDQSEALSLWTMSWVILVSACFGVVLEGPMGAVVFWTLLGMANAASARTVAAPAPLPPIGHSLPADEDLGRTSSPPRGELGSLSTRPDLRPESYPKPAFVDAPRPTNSP